MSKPSNSYDGKWGREIRAREQTEKAARERETMSNDTQVKQEDRAAGYDLALDWTQSLSGDGIEVDEIANLGRRISDLLATVRREVWIKVFNVVSDEASFGARQLVKSLEAAREEDNCGPVEASASKKGGRNGRSKSIRAARGQVVLQAGRI